MNLIKKENKPWLWYLIFSVCLTVVLLYIKFPSETLTNYIRVQAEKSYPDISIGYKKIGLTLPPGINIKGLSISLKEDPETFVYESEKTTIRISILGWLKGDNKYFFESAVKDGVISGFFEEKNEMKKERVDATIDIKGVSLDKNIFIHPALSERLEGILTGKITFMGNISDPLKGNTEIHLDMTDGKVKLKKPFLDLDALEFKKMNISGIIDNRRLNIKDLNMTGGPLNGSATGTVQIRDDLLNSRLNLKAEIEPSPSLSQDMPEVGNTISMMSNIMKDGKLRIDIQGTLDRPSPKFIQ
jgi:type II secretion system protein N